MRILYIFILSIITTVVFAADYLYCPKTSGYAYIGDSLEKVKQTCGNPINSAQAPPPQKTIEVTRWIWNFQPNSGNSRFGFKRMNKALVIDFKDQKIIKIVVEGSPVQQTNYCNPFKPLKIGDKSLLALALCHRASTEKNISQQIPEGSKQTVLTYKPEPYSPTVNLSFQDNKLRAID